MRSAVGCSLFVLIISVPTATRAEAHVAPALIADKAAIAPGEPFRVGVLFQIPENAHIYWHNPGDSGLPTELHWTIPQGFRRSDVQWPNPTAFVDDFLNETSFGYENEALVFVTVDAPYGPKAGDTIEVAVHAQWLVCLDDGACIPEDAELETRLPVGDEPLPSQYVAGFDAYAAQVPTGVADAKVPLSVTVSGNPAPAVRINVEPPWHIDAGGAAFFPDRGGPWRVDDAGDSAVKFAPTTPVDDSATGALTLPAENTATGERRTAYIRFGAPRGD
jgi:DsbC/DsbD-like thiol-disulfide interchange protein